MPGLTVSDRSQFTSAQLVEIDKISSARLNLYLQPGDSNIPAALYRALILGKWKLKSPEQIRASKVNLGRISWGSGGPTITWSADADYTQVEKDSIQDILSSSGGKFEDVAVAVAAGKRSVEQRLTAGSL
jgi:hypothetical protein